MFPVSCFLDLILVLAVDHARMNGDCGRAFGSVLGDRHGQVRSSSWLDEEHSPLGCDAGIAPAMSAFLGEAAASFGDAATGAGDVPVVAATGRDP